MKYLFTLMCTLFVLSATLLAQDPVLQLEAPRGGVTFYTTRDTIIEIRWSGVDDTVAVKLDYTTDNGRRWTVIEDSARGLTYPWNVKGLTPTSTYRVRVSQLRPPGAEDQVVYSGHNSAVVDAWWNPANTRVVSVAAEAHIWDAMQSTSDPLAALPGGRTQFTSVRWSADSTTIVTGSEDGEDGKVEVFDVASVTSTLALNLDTSVMKVEVDPTASSIFIQSLAPRVQIHRLRPTVSSGPTLFIGSNVSDIALNADGSRVVVSADANARVYPRLGGLPVTFNAHGIGGAQAAAFSPDGSRVCSIGGDLTTRMWNSATGVEFWNATDRREGVRSVAYSSDGSLVAVGMADSSIKVFRADSGILVWRFTNYSGNVRMVQFSPDGVYLAGASDDNFARIHDLTTGELKAAFQHRDNVNLVRWSNASDRLLTASNDGTARIWQVTSIVLQSDTTEQFTIAPPPPAFVRFVATGDTLNIEETTTITVRTENPQFLGLAEIDSVRLRLAYDPSMLFRTSSSIPLSVIDDLVNGRSKQFLICTVPLDTVAKDLFTVSFQATLGQDSVTRLTFDNVALIGKGPGARVEVLSDTILVRGICRIGDGPRMYNANGAPLAIVSRPLPDGIALDCTLSESATATLSVYDLRGALILRDRTTADEERSRRMRRVVPAHLLSGAGLVTLTTPTQSTTFVILDGGRP